MSLLLKYRERLNWTQDELSGKSGISVRTIQRIEAGAMPKGYTLKALANAMGVNEDDLVEKPVTGSFNTPLIKFINLSALLFVFLPPLNIIIPWAFMYYKKEINAVTKQIVSIQILWTIVSGILVVLSAFLKTWFFEELTLLVILLTLFVNLYIIIRNAIEIDRNGRLRIVLIFSFL